MLVGRDHGVNGGIPCRDRLTALVAKADVVSVARAFAQVVARDRRIEAPIAFAYHNFPCTMFLPFTFPRE
jgi:hypothetical protein